MDFLMGLADVMAAFLPTILKIGIGEWNQTGSTGSPSTYLGFQIGQLDTGSLVPSLPPASTDVAARPDQDVVHATGARSFITAARS
jgi:hypothetical protein